MKPTCVVSCPIDTFSGYGARSRDFVKGLIKSKEKEWDIKIMPQKWGDTPHSYLPQNDPIKQRLDTIDRLLQRCAENPDLSAEDRDKILEGLNVPRKGNIPPTSYRSQNGRVYNIEVIQDENSPAIAPKRKAIAKDFRGIVVLRGEASFASDPQVLIDELKLRIDNQLP